MGTTKKKTTIYFEPQLHEALRIKAAATSRTVSELINDAVRVVLADDAAELSAFKKREGEPVLSFEEVLKYLKQHGRI